MFKKYKLILFILYDWKNMPILFVISVRTSIVYFKHELSISNIASIRKHLNFSKTVCNRTSISLIQEFIH